MKILRSLIDKFESKKYAIEKSNDLNTMTPEILSSKLRVFEMELDMKKTQRSKNKNVFNDTSFAFNSAVEFDLDNFSVNGEVDIDSLDRQIAYLSKQFKKIVQVRNTYGAKQSRQQLHNNNFPHNRGT